MKFVFLQLFLVTTLLFFAAKGIDRKKLDPILASRALRGCYNEFFSSSGLSFSDYVEGKATRSIRLHRVWWSARDSDVKLGVFSMTDLSRLERLAAQCLSYPGGVVAAAVHLPLYEPPSATPENASSSSGTSGDSSHRRFAAAGQPRSAMPGLSAENAAKVVEAEAQLEELFQRMEEMSASAPASASGSPSGSNVTDPGTEAGSAASGAGAGAGSGRVGACVLRLLLLYEVVSEEAVLALFPINLVRNAGLLALDTPLVLSVDVDFSLNVGLSDSLADDKRVADMVQRGERNNTVWVVPAWETGCTANSSTDGEAVVQEVASTRVEDKGKFLDMWLYAQSIVPFHAHNFKHGHAATDYLRWISTASEYQVQYEAGYEPWFIITRKGIPVYDVRYRGRGYNKQVMMKYLVYNNYTLLVAPDVWMMHRPHEHTGTYGLLYKPPAMAAPPSPPSPSAPTSSVAGPSAAGVGVAETPDYMDMDVLIGNVTMKARDAFIGRNYGFYWNDVSRMHNKKYSVVTDMASKNCRRKLPWWRWLSES